MRQRKQYVAPPPVAVSTQPMAAGALVPHPLVIELPDNPSTKRTIDLSAWLGRGIDPWVHACASQLRAFVVGKSVQPSTADSYWTRGLIHFFRFLTTYSGPAAPGLLKPEHIRAFIAWLAEQGWSTGTRKVRYDKTKSVLLSLMASGLIPRHDDLFPANPHPGSNSSAKGQLPLSMGERDRLGKALRDDLIAIHHGKFAGTQSEALVVYLLALDLRCGANPTPLLEARRGCLMDHPFIPNMKRLALYKRRGNATKISSLRFSQTRDEEVSIPNDGVGLALQVLKMTQPLVAHAALEHRDRLWLYRSERPRDNGRVIVLTKNSLDDGITAVVDRHSLKGDDGKPLRLNVSRLRKTVELRLFDLSGGDHIVTAALMGQTVQVADVHYLKCTQQMRENATFVGDALPDIYRTGGADAKFIPILPGKTPTGRCKDPYDGDKAPKNGTACDDFFSCFMCTSYAITGSPDDLHRLFSFYCFLEREMHKARSADWRAQFRNTMLLIDRFTADKFEAASVEQARDRARTDPLRFWASYSLTEPTAGDEAVHGN
ncbi:MAG: hypothetical protein RI906_1201 [Pseudomonadota bacterium]|jgi:hypothetical protein